MPKYVADHELREGWRNLQHPWERLRWARKYWQNQSGGTNTTAKHAAEVLGMQEGTYRAYERAAGTSKSTALDAQRAIQFGRKFKVSWEWILLNEGDPFKTSLTPAQLRVIQSMATVDEDQQNALADLAEAFVQTQVQRQRQG